MLYVMISNTTVTTARYLTYWIYCFFLDDVSSPISFCLYISPSNQPLAGFFVVHPSFLMVATPH